MSVPNSYRYHFHRIAQVLAYVCFVILGVGLLFGFVCFYSASFSGSDSLKDYPWSFLSVLVAGPITLYLWYWKHINAKRSIADQLFNAAAVNLSDDSPHVRLTAIYSLVNLVNTYHDRAPIAIEVLCSFLRINSVAPPLPSVPEHSLEHEKWMIENKICLDMISRIWCKYYLYWNFKINDRPDLRQLKLESFEFHGVFLKDFFLERACFKNAFLVGANFSGAYLGFSDLSGAKLKNANLDKACVRGADFSGAVLLDQKTVNKADGCKATLLPDYILPPAAWDSPEKCHLTLYCNLDCRCKDVAATTHDLHS